MDPLPGRAPSKEDEFYLEWARETTKKNIETAQSVLAQLLTLNTALMGGSVAFLSPDIVSKSWQKPSLVLFFFSFCVSIWGILPHETKFNPLVLQEFKNHKKIALERKRLYMWGSAILTIAGLLLIGIAVIFGQNDSKA